MNQELNDYIDNLCDNVKELIINAASEKEEADLKMYNSSLEQLKFSEVEREFIVFVMGKVRLELTTFWASTRRYYQLSYLPWFLKI